MHCRSERAGCSVDLQPERLTGVQPPLTAAVLPPVAGLQQVVAIERKPVAALATRQADRPEVPPRSLPPNGRVELAHRIHEAAPDLVEHRCDVGEEARSV